MKFQAGDLVEVLHVPLFCTAHEQGLRAGHMGTVISSQGCGGNDCDCTHVPSSVVDFPAMTGGKGCCAPHGYLRKIQPDDGRELSRWDRCDWRPSRNLVLA
jgi:hypothetical protein